MLPWFTNDELLSELQILNCEEAARKLYEETVLRESVWRYLNDPDLFDLYYHIQDGWCIDQDAVADMTGVACGFSELLIRAFVAGPEANNPNLLPFVKSFTAKCRELFSDDDQALKRLAKGRGPIKVFKDEEPLAGIVLVNEFTLALCELYARLVPRPDAM